MLSPLTDKLHFKSDFLFSIKQQNKPIKFKVKITVIQAKQPQSQAFCSLLVDSLFTPMSTRLKKLWKYSCYKNHRVPKC